MSAKSDGDTLAGQAGIDLWRCEFCDEKVKRAEDYVQGLDGMRAHRTCVDAFMKRERRRDREAARALGLIPPARSRRIEHGLELPSAQRSPSTPEEG